MVKPKLWETSDPLVLKWKHKLFPNKSESILASEPQLIIPSPINKCLRCLGSFNKSESELRS